MMVIYKATNRVNGKVYIGQAQNLPKRKLSHKSRALKGDRKCHFSSAIRKYGFDNFDFIVIDKDQTQEGIDEKERCWIRFYDARNREKGYNNAEGGRVNRGNKWSEEQRKLASARLKEDFRTGKRKPSKNFGPLPEETKKKMSETHKKLFKEKKRVYVKLSKESSAIRAKKATETIVLLKHFKVTKKELANIPESEKLEYLKIWRKNLEDTRARRIKTVKDWIVICLETGIEYKSILDASRLTGANDAAISMALKKGGTAKGMHWALKSSFEGLSKEEVINRKKQILSDCPKLPIICLETGERHSLTSAAKKIGVSRYVITRAIRHLDGKIGGFTWKYYNEPPSWP